MVARDGAVRPARDGATRSVRAARSARDDTARPVQDAARSVQDSATRSARDGAARSVQDGATRSVRDGAARSVQMVGGLYVRSCDGDWHQWHKMLRDRCQMLRDWYEMLRGLVRDMVRVYSTRCCKIGTRWCDRGQYEMLRDEIGARMPDAVRLVREAAAIGARWCALVRN